MAIKLWCHHWWDIWWILTLSSVLQTLSVEETHLSPETVIRCLQSLLNFNPVTISDTHTHTRTKVICNSWVNSVFQIKDTDRSVRTWWPHTPRSRSQRCWCSCPNRRWRCRGQTGRSAPEGGRGGGVNGCRLSRCCRCHGDGELTYLNEGSILALRAFVQLLLFAVADVEDPAGGNKPFDRLFMSVFHHQTPYFSLSTNTTLKKYGL